MYATPILQPTTPVAHLATGLAIYAYLPMNPCRLPQPSPADRLFFTDASGESALTPITGGATLQLTHTGGHYHMDHHTGHTTYGASSHGELGAMADAMTEIAAHLPTHSPHIVGLVRGRRHCRHTPAPPHSKATTSQRHRVEPRHPDTAASESLPQRSPLRSTPHRETRVPQTPIRKW